ncbi:MAG: serine/threonine protein kinase [Caldilineaceae bacterium]|nr:serine/threonine protein kinase [Caldilineaceae bacterium]
MARAASSRYIADQQPANQFGPYQIEHAIGAGAVARVFQARDGQGATVALKVMLPAAAAQAQLRDLFRLEYRALARLRHPNIVRVYASGDINGLPYLAMELVEGETLETFLLRAKRLGEPAAIAIINQIADALDYLHQQGFIHRDIKPANIMLTPAGQAKLFDFGTVYETAAPPLQDMGIYGTPAFLAPEQIAQDRPVDGRTDLYALGILLYLMTAGRKPFYGGRSEVLDAHVNQPPPPPSEFQWVSPEIEAIILKAIAKDPAARFQTGRELIDALAEADLAAEPPRPELGRRLFGWLRADGG